MRKVLLISILLLSIGVYAQAEEVTMQSLLREMVNREQLAEFPTIPFRTLQASSYNRASVSPNLPGWFADSDGIWCIREETNKNGETEWVLMEDDGPGAIAKIWAVCFYYTMDNKEGANVKIYLDGEDEPTINCNFFAFVQGRAFVKPPLSAETCRAGNIYLPIPYAKSCKITMDKKVFYNIINYRHYPKGTSVRTFSMDEYNKSMSLVDSVNQVLAEGCVASPGNINKKQTIKPGESMSINLKKGGAISMMSIILNSADTAQALRSTVLKATFDGEQTIWSPVGDFFNNGPGYKAYRMWERAVEDDGKMICRWIMPYRKNAVISLENLGKEDVTVDMSLETEPYKWTSQTMYFHSTWRIDDPTPTFPLFDYNLVQVDGAGTYVGDQFTVLNPAEGWWGEGDEKVYVDDDTFPSHFGTGTEDYYGWAGGIVPNPVDEFSKPFLANVRVASPNSKGYNTCTRTRVLDAIPFQKRLDFNIESSCGKRISWFHLHYSVNSYWYAKPGAVSNRKPLPEMAARKTMTLEQLEQFNDSCKLSKYTVPNAIEAETLVTYQVDNGVNQLEGQKIWGNLSNDAEKTFTFDAIDKVVNVSLTELFNKTSLKVCLTTGDKGGLFDIMVNGQFIKSVNLLSTSQSYIVDLGDFVPVDNSLKITFVCKKPGNLGIDYFLVK